MFKNAIYNSHKVLKKSLKIVFKYTESQNNKNSHFIEKKNIKIKILIKKYFMSKRIINYKL